MLEVRVLELHDPPADFPFYLLIYLLPHPKPLWKTEVYSATANPVSYAQTFRQCIRPKDLSKVFLLTFNCVHD
ncbi:unnamed protein product [Gongylonema pulchrum]|uniref:Ovule protein n=1 Tax=Gongylonema pulchrum TaxID=637853 RepID=A0A183DAL2_9BILA|nr:unnamed protein product [Gongylonema pulchrum]